VNGGRSLNQQQHLQCGEVLSNTKEKTLESSTMGFNNTLPVNTLCIHIIEQEVSQTCDMKL